MRKTCLSVEAAVFEMAISSQLRAFEGPWTGFQQANDQSVQFSIYVF
jgi:hypothetical protein